MSQEEAPNTADGTREVVSQQQTESLVDQLPLGEGVVAGSGAFLLAYLFYHQVVTFLTTFGSASSAGPSGWVVSGWYFFASHNVPVQAGGETAAVSVLPRLGTSGTNFFIGGWPVQMLLLFAPAFGLIGAGYLVVSWEDPDELVDLALSVAAVAIPYLVLSVVAAFLMTHTYTNSGAIGTIISNVEPLAQQYSNGQPPSSLNVGVSITNAALFAGIVYPVVFGGLGGIAAKKDLVVDEITARLN
ncbi:hypothetical protein SAMN06269185_2388 [Natronoarchaeum philippinense]|uniref:DUF7978 domain-containing protein n=1 Tax=Natronoarchaeum philippinense TaxID=558529 RepID=A0A285P0Z7_NATPI|nr:hypothetical protein [Natronoarchaeum philippinense]SNZ15128.1 hypothetical protein SAMN06269185_2388 [Natronoarchaeum philippinense]